MYQTQIIVHCKTTKSYKYDQFDYIRAKTDQMKCTGHINVHVGLDEGVGVINDVQSYLNNFFTCMLNTSPLYEQSFSGDIASMAFSHKEIMKPTSKILFFTLTRSQTSL